MINMWALIQNGTVAEITDIDPAGRFHESLKWVLCSAVVQAGYRYADGKFSAPPEPEKPTQAALLALAKTELRTIRAPMLDALTGIAGRAVRAGNDALAAEADALAELLLEITDDPALNAATTYEEMQAAGVAAYKRIAGSVSQELKVVFREITGV